MKPSPTDDKPNSRSTLLADASRNVGRMWAEGWFAELRRQGRPVTGGWPGTMSEARGRIRVHVDSLLTQRAWPSITYDELADATRVTYDSAKALWLGCQARGEGVA